MQSNRYFPYIILCSAVSLTAAAAFYSVYGLSRLFAGASTAVIVMASSLEFANIVSTTALKIYWSSLPNWLKSYLVIAVIVLSLITSAGIYGFLSDAYQKTANVDKISESKLELLNTKRSRYSEQLKSFETEKSGILNSIELLRKSLGTDNQYQTVDRKTGLLVTQIQSTSKKSVQSQLDVATAQLSNLNIKIDEVGDSISQYDIRIIELKSNNSTSELGPLKYLSGLTGRPMDQIVNWFLMLLIFVFQPLAIALVLTSLFAFGQINKQFSIKFNTSSGFFKPNIPVIQPASNPVYYQTSSGFKTIPKKRTRKRRSTNPTPTNETVPERMFNIEIPGLEPVDNSKVVERNLTPDIAEHIRKTLIDKKKKNSRKPKSK